MKKRKGWLLLLSILSFIVGCNSIEGMREMKERTDREGKMVLETIDRYVQKAEITALRAERAWFSYLIKILPKSISRQGDGGRREER